MLTVRDFIAGLRSGPYVWPGGYPIFLVTTDGGCLCHGCAFDERWQIARDTRDKRKVNIFSQWAAEGWAVNWEDPDLYCDHCGERIESAYAEPDEPEPAEPHFDLE